MRSSVVIPFPSRAPVAAVLATTLGACGSCGGPSAGLSVEGDHPYVRCLEVAPPDEDRWQVGSTELLMSGRVLRVRAGDPPWRVAVFAGPGLSAADPAGPVRAVGALDPDLVVVLGDLGDGEAQALKLVAALGTLAVPSLVLAGGRDEAEVVDEVLDELAGAARDRVLDGRGIRRVELGGHHLVPVSGAPDGRYARTRDACGYGPEDLRRLHEALGEPGQASRWLLGWAAPERPGIGLGHAGIRAGDSALTELGERIGAAGGAFAWPRGAAGRPVDSEGRAVAAGTASRSLWVVVPPLVGPALERSDGTRLPAGPSLLELGPGGARWLSEDGANRADPGRSGSP